MRARNIKPGFFKNENLSDLTAEARLFFIGLWCYADREGLLEWRPRRIKAEIFPYISSNVGKLLSTLAASLFVEIYKTEVNTLIVKIVNFGKHQRPHKNEIPSILREKLKLATLVESTYYQGANHFALNDDCLILNDDMRNEECSKPGGEVHFQGSIIKILVNSHKAFKAAYPKADLEAEYKKMDAWAVANPKKAPKKDFARFANGWLGRIKKPEDIKSGIDKIPDFEPNR